MSDYTWADVDRQAWDDGMTGTGYTSPEEWIEEKLEEFADDGVEYESEARYNLLRRVWTEIDECNDSLRNMEAEIEDIRRNMEYVEQERHFWREVRDELGGEE